MRTVFLLFSLLCALLLLLPAAVCGIRTQPDNPERQVQPETGCDAATEQAFESETESSASFASEEDFLYRLPETILLETEDGRITLALEDYVRGILMGEMLSSFDDDAWMALAVAARTYAAYRVAHELPLSDNSAVCCAYLSDADADARFGNAYSIVSDKARAAVERTQGEILLYENQPACTVFHAMSYQKTASAEAVWGNAVPYLVSVSTPEELSLSGMVTTRTFDAETLCSLLGGERILPLSVTYDDGVHMKSVTAADGRCFSGTEFRALLSLPSGAVRITEQTAGSMVCTVNGRGHGVGMSQWGAAAMAASGADYTEILAHYYRDTILKCCGK